MKTSNQVFTHMALSGLVILGLLGDGLPAAAQQSSAKVTNQQTAAEQEPQASTTSTMTEQANISELPDSPGAVLSRMQDQSPTQSDNSQQTNSQPAAAQSSTQLQNQPAPAPAPPQKPVGTAAAETPVVSGVAASQPAGVAIAPAKQRRARTIVLRMGALVGAGVALGTVVALTQATPSKPPGAR
ncbi:MAG: hypothetical protein LAO24_17825 [Acidobacteriia bacterium]|nr:hypothetical protein [Terriglobia bacterium]